MSKNVDVILNEEIDFPEIRCVGDDGEQYGLISSQEALKIAEDKDISKFIKVLYEAIENCLYASMNME